MRIDRFCSCIFKKIIKESDSDLQKTRKEIFVVVHCVAIIMYTMGTLFQWDVMSNRLSNFVGFATHVVVFYRLVVAKEDVTNFHAASMLILYAAQVIPADLHKATEGAAGRLWPINVVLVDVALLCEVPHFVSFLLIILVIAYLSVVAFESSLRVGIFDLPGTISQSQRYNSGCGCDTLPCAIPLAESYGAFFSQAAVLLIDFVCTRGFAEAALSERCRILTSIETAHMVAKSLAKFDLHSANELLTNIDTDVPDGLRDAFLLLLSNLNSYKPYLPQSCLPFEFTDDIQSVKTMSSTPSDDCQMEHSLAEFKQSKLCNNSLTDSSRSSDPGCSRTLSLPVRVCRLGKALKHHNASLFIVNITHSITVLEGSPEQFSNLISSLVSCTADIVTKNKGTTDIFLGDRVFANFGAARKCFTHCASCLKASQTVVSHMKEVLQHYQGPSYAPDINIGMASGTLMCGDLGCEVMLRFSTVGRLALWVGVVERAGRMLNVPLIADQTMYAELKHCTEMKASLQPVLFDGIVNLLFEVGIVSADSSTAEWMYQLASIGSGKWEKYNGLLLRMLSKKNTSSAWEDNSDEDTLSALRSGLHDPILFNHR